jgi:hypothetical protein
MHPLIRRTQASERSPETARTAPFASAFYALVLPLCRLLPYGRSVISRSISKPLSDDALNRALGALHVIYAEPNAIAIAKVELSKVTVQVLFAAMLVDAGHATLENRIVTFNGIGVDDPTHIFISRMVDGLVHPKFLAETLIGAQLVSHHERFFRDVSANDGHQLRVCNAIHMKAARFAATSDESHCDVGTTWTAFFLAFLLSDKGLVNFNDLTGAAHGFDANDVASRRRCDMNHAVLRVTPKVR